MLYGKYFLEHNTLIADHTIFSWTPTTNDTIYVTWLPDIFLYLLHKAAGLPGIFAFRYLCMLVPVAGCYFYARKLKIVTHPLTWLLCLLAVIMSYTAAFEKPEILSFVFMTLLAWNWWHIRSSGEEAWKNCYLFPVIMLAWVNTHGGFVFGAVFLFLIWLGEMCNTWLSPQNTLSPRLRKHLTIALFVSAIMPFLTPYGYHYPLQLYYDFLPTAENANFNSKIAAYASPFAFENPHNFVLAADITILLLALLLIRNIARVEWSTLISNFVFAFLYTQFFRTTFYWVPIFLFSGINLLAVQPLASKSWHYAKLFTSFLPGLVLTAAISLAGHTMYQAMVTPEKWLWLGFGISDSNPVAEADYIATYFPTARIGNTYDQGAYLLWKLWPQNRVFFDARHFPYRAWSNDFFAFSRGIRIKPILDKYPCDIWCIGLQNRELLKGLLGSKEWKIAFVGKNAVVLVRVDIPLPNDAPRVSNDLYEQKNLITAIDLIAFAIITSDWEIGEHLFAVMQNTFKWKEQQKSLQWAEYNLVGFRAYLQDRDYHTAIKNLEQISESPAYTRFVITNCYQFLTQEAWKRNDITRALKFARRSLNLVPDNPYSLYNVGIILWQQEQTLPPEEHRRDWQRFLVKFLRSAPHDQDFNPFRSIAKDMLDGSKHQERPPLLIPPEPTLGRAKNPDDNP
ncbi:MAG: hypothetical protein A2505_03270 [Deltaproteobacteria bacterium RIFOXYD12_FULL_55_16]|nr:MAG: hypothetical protein A2505_03270 [Deltaproteobacteria bacterium RIFOXYD12_FULL_55_16]